MQLGEVWVEAGELLGELPDGDDEEEDIDNDDETHGAVEAPDEAVFERQPAARREGREHMFLLNTYVTEADNSESVLQQ